MKRMVAVLLGGLLLLSCGRPSSVRPTPTPSGAATPTATATATATPTATLTVMPTASRTPVPTPTASPRPSSTPTQAPSPTPPRLQAGVFAYVSVSVATLWRSPNVVRAVDGPALTNPVRIRDWINAMSWWQKADLIGRADSQALLGDRVLVLALSGGWAHVTIPGQPTPLDSRGYPGWIPVAQLSPVAPRTSGTVAAVVSPTAWLQKSNGTSIELSFGTRLPVLSQSSSSVSVGLPGGETGTIATARLIVTASGTLPATAESVIASAEAFRGLSYLWAGTSGFGYDCSGLVYQVYAMHGIRLPRDADAQATAGHLVTRAALQPGDLVFFGSSAATIHHVAIYVGAGNILESPQTGYPVRTIPLSTYADYFTARRVLG